MSKCMTLPETDRLCRRLDSESDRVSHSQSVSDTPSRETPSVRDWRSSEASSRHRPTLGTHSTFVRPSGNCSVIGYSNTGAGGGVFASITTSGMRHGAQRESTGRIGLGIDRPLSLR